MVNCPVPDIMDKYIREIVLPRKVPDRDGNQEAATVYGRIQSESGAGESATGYDNRSGASKIRRLHFDDPPLASRVQSKCAVALWRQTQSKSQSPGAGLS